MTSTIPDMAKKSERDTISPITTSLREIRDAAIAAMHYHHPLQVCIFAGCWRAHLALYVMPKLINIRQVAELFGVSKRTVEGWVKDGKLPKPVRRFGFRRWDADKLESLLKNRRKT